MARFHARVQVQLRPSVLDPAGEATRAAAAGLGVEGLQTLRIGKAVELSLDADSEDLAREQVQLLCARLLANPVTENWTMSLEEQKA
ncbi:MAG: phosphoribosylformylglycinamidine synthase [Synechococcus sp. TMED19]|nr:MAG: phosphoribosylformylglycinamidine synthase [Synechococcus sp. TMED19]